MSEHTVECLSEYTDHNGETHSCGLRHDHVGRHKCGGCSAYWRRYQANDYVPKSYWQYQLDKVSGGPVKVQFTDESGLVQTHRLSLTRDQFEQVKGFLLSIEEGLV